MSAWFNEVEGVHYSLTGHAILRFASAHVLDPVEALLLAQKDLAFSYEVNEEEARRFLNSGLRFRAGRTYRAGAGGVYICEGNRVITYIDRQKRFRSKEVRGWAQKSRAARMRFK